LPEGQETPTNRNYKGGGTSVRNRVFGAIGVIWGGFILINALFRGVQPAQNAAGQSGQYVGLGFGVLLFTAGLYYLIRGDGSGFGKKKKKKRKSAIRTPI
jgi:hypothetical protein